MDGSLEMNIRTLMVGLFVSVALVSAHTIGFSQTPQNQTNKPAAPTLAPATPTNTLPDTSDLTLTSQSKTQPVSDDDINRFTNTIVLIKDFYVKSMNVDYP